MAKRVTIQEAQRANTVLAGTVVAVVVVACLYWAHAVFIPLALAIFLAFLFNPVVTTLQGYGMKRTPAVLAVVLSATLMVGGAGWIVTSELVELVAELPDYSDNIEAKIESIKEVTESAAARRLGKIFSWRPADSMHHAKNADGPSPAPVSPPAADPPVGGPPNPPRDEIPAWIAGVPSLLGAMIESLTSFALAAVLAIFMLLKRENLRNRLIRLMGRNRMTATTKAIDDAAQRISRFLLMQLVVNATFGMAMALGLLVIGVPYALLWGFLAAVLRYVPYVGAWISAVPPIVLSVIIFQGWTQPILVIGLFLAIELVCSNAIEPWLYGQSMGVSEVGLLVAAAFWAFLWGPIGLVLSSPLTVCLVVLGKYVPHLEFFDVLLGDEPALEPHVSFYQRLLARDQDEATHIVLDEIGASQPELIYDQILLPALSSAKRDRAHDRLTDEDEQFVQSAIGEIVEDLGERVVESVPSSDDDANAAQEFTRPAAKVSILACPARDAADQLALEMLRQLLDPAKWDVRVVALEMLAAELVELAEGENPGIVCIGSLPPGGLAHTRYLCKRLRARLPKARIVVGRWGVRGNIEQTLEQLRNAGANHVGTSLSETRDHLIAWLPVLTQEDAGPSPRSDRQRSEPSLGAS